MRVARGGHRALYYEIDVTVKWQAMVNADKESKRNLGHPRYDGITRIWNVSHSTTRDEWKDATGLVGQWGLPAGQLERIVKRYLPTLAPQLKEKVELLINRMIAKANGKESICV